jgi:hypothetical protein
MEAIGQTFPYYVYLCGDRYYCIPRDLLYNWAKNKIRLWNHRKTLVAAYIPRSILAQFPTCGQMSMGSFNHALSTTQQTSQVLRDQKLSQQLGNIRYHSITLSPGACEFAGERVEMHRSPFRCFCCTTGNGTVSVSKKNTAGSAEPRSVQNQAY